MAAAGHDVHSVAGGAGLGVECFGVDKEPGEWLAHDITVLHAIGQFAIVAACVGEIEIAVVILKDVADVR